MLESVKETFKKIKEYFSSKKVKEQSNEDCFYLVGFSDDVAGFCIIEQKILLSAFLNKMPIRDLLYTDDVQYLGWHLGKDSKLYQKFVLKDIGINNYLKAIKEDFGWDRVNMLCVALNEIVENKRSIHLSGPKKQIQTVFSKSLVGFVKKYDRTEFLSEEESQKEIEQTEALLTR